MTNNDKFIMGNGGGLVVTALAFYCNNPSSNHAGYLNFLNNKTKINEKEPGVGSSVKKIDIFICNKKLIKNIKSKSITTLILY